MNGRLNVYTYEQAQSEMSHFHSLHSVHKANNYSAQLVEMFCGQPLLIVFDMKFVMYCVIVYIFRIDVFAVISQLAAVIIVRCLVPFNIQNMEYL
jgi:hypothetical protein